MPLYSFAATGVSDIEIAKMLLAAGADPRIEDENHDTTLPYGKTPISYVGNDTAMKQLLVAAGAK